MFELVEEHVAKSILGFTQSLQHVKVVAFDLNAPAPDALGESNGDRAHAPTQNIVVLCLEDEVDVIWLERILHDSQTMGAGVLEGPQKHFKGLSITEISIKFKINMQGMAGAYLLPRPVRDAL
jgi:hypothetical protein